jgi:NAD+ synthase (glutamine-hydrolysing)
VKIALAQLNPTVGDIAGNTRLIEDAITLAQSGGASLVVFPELVICGYPPRDLLRVQDFVQRCESSARQIGETRSKGLAIVIGTPLRNRRGSVANGLLVYRDGLEIARYEKRLLPTYDVFDEDRYFEPGDSAVVFEHDEKRVGLAICEDLWRGEDAGASERYADAVDPIAALKDRSIDLLAVPSASPFVLGKHQKHRQIVAQSASMLGVPVASVNQVGANDDLIFDGRSCVVTANGRTLCEANAFLPDLVLVETADDSHAPDPIAIDDERLLIDALTLGTRDYLAKCGFRSACLGLSGGIDSALTAAIGVRALGADNMLGAAMPGPYSSEGSMTDAYALAENLGMRCITMPIAAGFDGHRAILDEAFRTIGTRALGEDRPDVTEENLQSRVRGALMMGLSNRTGAMLLTTGNKSEVAVGYCTLYGDMNGGLALISDLPKTLVFQVSRYMNEHFESLGFASPPIPQATIDKPPSAELAPGQLDTDSLPPYDILDEIVDRHVERSQSAAQIIRETGHDPTLIERICRLIDVNEYKRRQYAVGLKVTSIAFGPGRRMPIAQRWRR